MSADIVVSTDDTNGASNASEAVEERTLDAVVDAAVNADRASREAVDAEVAAANAEFAASTASSNAAVAETAANIVLEAAQETGRSLDEVYSILGSLDERISSAIASALTPPPVEETASVEEILEEEPPRGEHFWFKNPFSFGKRGVE